MEVAKLGLAAFPPEIIALFAEPDQWNEVVLVGKVP